MPTDRRRLVVAGLAAALSPAARCERDAALPSLAVVPPDFLEDHPRPDAEGAQARRLAAAHEQLERELAAARLYRVVDFAPARPLLATLRAQQQYMHRCADCLQQLGRALGAERVMATWVQKVSELILNLNVELHDTASGRSLLAKSVDMRGNTDESWRRAAHFLVRDMAEKRAANPRYGLR